MNVYAILDNPLKVNSIDELILSIVDGALIILIPFLTLALVYIGFRMVMAFSKGDASGPEYTKWKDTLLWTLLGLAIVLGAKGILEVLKNSISNILA